MKENVKKLFLKYSCYKLNKLEKLKNKCVLILGIYGVYNEQSEGRTLTLLSVNINEC